MANDSRPTYVEPKDRYKKVNMEVILKYEPIIVGIYCKLVTLSSGKSLSIEFLAKKLQVSKERMRKTIVFLESEGYIVRHPLRDEKNRMNGWNYYLYAEPVKNEERTHAGVKGNKNEESPCCGDSRVTDSPCYGISDNTETPEDIIIDNAISNNNIDNGNNIDSVPCGTSRTHEEQVYIDRMKEKFPRIMRMEQPLTMEQAKALASKYDRDLLAKIMQEMENYKPLLKKYVSASRVIDNWCQRELDRL